MSLGPPPFEPTASNIAKMLRDVRALEWRLYERATQHSPPAVHQQLHSAWQKLHGCVCALKLALASASPEVVDVPPETEPKPTL